ncbi:unnamed protein product, partial [Tetraodon nigroviridis]
SRYPSPAELDAFAQKTANSPLSIKIFPSDVRVPQHKQLNKTVNGFDTTGYGAYSQPFSGGYQGLLAVVKASVVVKGVVKTAEGRRTKHANGPASAAPYNNPLNNGYAVRRGHKACPVSSCKPPDVPVETLCSNARTASGDRSQAPQSELAQVQSLMRQMSRIPHSQALQVEGGARASPSLRAVAAVARSDSEFAPGVPPQSSLAFTGAVIPSQCAQAAKAGYVEKAAWHQRRQQQPFQPGAGGMYGEAGPAPQSHLPLRCASQLPYGPHPDQVGGSSLNHAAVAQYFAPLWDGVVATPHSDCYTPQVLAAPRELGLSHPHLLYQPPQRHQAPLQPPPPAHAQGYGADLCCGLSGSGLCHAAALSSSLQSLECLISEIQPPCIKERMLGRGYQTMGVPHLLEHHQQSHIQLPVHR